MTGYDAACALLPGEMRAAAYALPEALRARAQEFRLRLHRPPSVTVPEGETPLGYDRPVAHADLMRMLEIATQASPYSAAAGIRSGYINGAGGVRVGLCGRMRQGAENSWSQSGLSSAVIRIPREVRDCGRRFCQLPFVSTLILSPPGAGKTTLLRDMVRCLSDGGLRVALCDERGEVAGAWDEGFAFDLGARTDVLSDCKKADAAIQLLRTMNPQVIAMDEITAKEDIQACLAAAGCGVALLATAHAGSPAEFRAGTLFQKLGETGVFRRVIWIRCAGRDREYREEAL